MAIISDMRNTKLLPMGTFSVNQNLPFSPLPVTWLSHSPPLPSHNFTPPYPEFPCCLYYFGHFLLKCIAKQPLKTSAAFTSCDLSYIFNVFYGSGLQIITPRLELSSWCLLIIQVVANLAEMVANFDKPLFTRVCKMKIAASLK